LASPIPIKLPEALAGAGTTLTAVLPERLARLLVRHGRTALKMVELPVQLPMITIRLHWSAGAWRDEGVDWLREQVMASARDCAAPGALAA
jgi:DNA-binding transcriptional LysR family regulator